ncbi:UPF0235 proteinVC395_0502-like isoform X3 [Lycorma delicatula]|uniref:UPF0235 proteinVC395_0502-like isoform X3 n=1 Tax=Lycorma delicatula TaxID=130591 RepID=UPI003F511220
MFSIQLFFIIALISCVTQKSFTKKKYHFVTVDDYDNLYIHVYVKPGCKKNKITDMDFSSISVDITTKDVGKECNEELIKYLAKVLQIKEDYLSIEKDTFYGRHKILTLTKIPGWKIPGATVINNMDDLVKAFESDF